MVNELSIIEKIIGYISADSIKRILYPDMKAAFVAIFHDTQSDYGWMKIMPDPAAIKNLEQRAIILSQSTTDRLKGNLRYELLEGMQANESVDTISQRLKDVFKGDDVNTERIARNEVIVSSKAGRMEAYESAGVWGREWMTVNSDRTCALCEAMDGKVAKTGDLFKHPETGADIPYDQMHPMCRCTTKPIMKAIDYNEKVVRGRSPLFDIKKKIIHIKATSKRKAHDRKIADVVEPPRKGTSKIEKLPENIQNEILDMRRQGMSGVDIASNLESSLGALSHNVQDKLVSLGVIHDTKHTLKMTPQGITDWAKSKGVAPKSKRRSTDIKTDRAETKYNIIQDQLTDANKSIADLTTENARLVGKLADTDRVRKENARHRDDKRKLHDEVAKLESKVKELEAQNIEDFVEEHEDVSDIGDYGFDGDDEYERDM